MVRALSRTDLPGPLAVLAELALDLRWTWSHAGDALWGMLDPEGWERTRNPWTLLQDVSRARLDGLAADADFRRELDALVGARRRYLADPGWYAEHDPAGAVGRVAYFSMEFGLGESLPLYAGGLGVLAGDYLKTASDLGVPVVGVGLLYQVGYFRQLVDAGGWQQEMYPYNEPASLPIQPQEAPAGGWLHVPLDLPGRTLLLRVWRAQVGRVPLYLLDSNDPMNSPADRGITAELYGGGPEQRLEQELVLGVAGWRTLEAVGLDVDVCHLNEGHAAFVVLERARRFAERHGAAFAEALAATRAGNVFTTHTPVAAGFDAFPADLVARYVAHAAPGLARLGLEPEQLLALGRRDPRDPGEPFNMAYLAMRGCLSAGGVSRLHGAVSRRVFAGLYPRWPEAEVPVGHVTNGVHVPSWDSRWADRVWTEACGKARWLGETAPLPEAIRCVDDAALWAFRAEERADLVRYARARLGRQLGQRGAPPARVAEADRVLDPAALTLGFARRFAAYKRPNLLLRDPERLVRLLTSAERPVQIIVAGKAHPRDEEGKRLVQQWAAFAERPAVRARAVFLEDYDMTLAQELVQGVDVWINTPRRPWEACGTSGMKVLVNGGLNLSVLDGWWAEAYRPDAGWTLGGAEAADADEAEALYRQLEEEIVPAFYARDAEGTSRAWTARIRTSMAALAPAFSSNRMMAEYVASHYAPAAAAVRRRAADGARLARELAAWTAALGRAWSEVGLGPVAVRRQGDDVTVEVAVRLGALSPEMVDVEVYADGEADAPPVRVVLARGAAVAGAAGAWLYRGAVAARGRPPSHFTPRVVPRHPEARVPIEAPFIAWAGG